MVNQTKLAAFNKDLNFEVALVILHHRGEVLLPVVVDLVRCVVAFVQELDTETLHKPRLVYDLHTDRMYATWQLSNTRNVSIRVRQEVKGESKTGEVKTVLKAEYALGGSPWHYIKPREEKFKAMAAYYKNELGKLLKV